MLEDLPLIKADITVLSPTPIETEVKVENKKLSEIPESNVVIATNLLSKNNVSFPSIIYSNSNQLWFVPIRLN